MGHKNKTNDNRRAANVNRMFVSSMEKMIIVVKIGHKKVERVSGLKQSCLIIKISLQ